MSGDSDQKNAGSRNQDDIDRRKWQRTAPSFQPAYIWVSTKKRLRAEVLDESEGGLGLLLTTDEPLEVGFQVRVETSSGRRTARIMFAERVEDSDKVRVGLAWDLR